MKNKFLAFAILIFSCFFAVSTAVKAQHSSVSFNKKGISVAFKVETSTPETTRQTFGSVYFTGYNDTEKESRVHRVLADRESGLYFGYDLVIESSSEPNKFKVSFRQLSMTPPETLRLSDLTMRSLPKYPEDLTVEDGDTIALDLLYNPQTKVKIVDLIKITTKKPQSSDTSLFTTTANASGASSKSGTGLGTTSGTSVSSGSGTVGGLFSKSAVRDFTPNDVKLRLTSPKLFINGAVGNFTGSEWEGIIEGSVIYVYVPGKGRFVFTLFPKNGFNFQKTAVVESNKITFESNGERYELISDAPIVSTGGDWNLWTLYDQSYRPDLIFSSAASGYIEYGAANEVENLLKQDWRKSRLSLVQPLKNKAEIYAQWFNEVRYIASDAEKQAFSRLNTDEEFEQFTESFWLRRDPNPGTKENEFRREYYGRIAYANQNFAYGKTAGWLTDRGRIFITHGKPDEIQKNGMEEIWIYNSLPELGGNVRFEFIDAANNGDFRLRK